MEHIKENFSLDFGLCLGTQCEPVSKRVRIKGLFHTVRASKDEVEEEKEKRGEDEESGGQKKTKKFKKKKENNLVKRTSGERNGAKRVSQ
jgi:hypothetical protein